MNSLLNAGGQCARRGQRKAPPEWTWHCDHEVDILGVPAKGKRTMVRGISYVALQNGEIVAERDYWDAATLLRQLGALK